MGDLIDRNAAIQICNDAENFWEGLSGVTGIHSVRSEISKLPSVPSEIIRCKDCKWCEDADGLMCKNTASWVVATDYDFGCVCAERRQDG